MKKRLLTSDEVKSMLGVDDFRSLKKDKIIEFISAIPYMDKEVAIKVIDQFPAFSEYAQVMVTHFSSIINNVVEANGSCVNSVLSAYESTLSLLNDLAKREDITSEERRIFAEMAVSVADKIATVDACNKEFLKSLLKTGIWFLGTGLCVCAVIFGVNVKASKFPTFPS